MMKKVLHILFWIVLLAWFPVIMGFVNRARTDLLCNEISIHISDSIATRFVTEESVRDVLAASGVNLQGYPLEEIDTRKLEKILEKNPYVYNAEVFANIEGQLNIDIDQRRPLIRLMPQGKSGYYLDAEGVILPLSEEFSPMVLLLTGRISPGEISENNGIQQIILDKEPESKQLLSFASFIDQNKFWNGQIVQLYTSGPENYEIIPRVGAHQIILGSLDEYEYKLAKLKILYEKGLEQYGWNTYNKINLKYSNQIICTKR